MKVTFIAVIEGKVKLETSAEVNTFSDLSKLARKLEGNVRGVKKTLPDLAEKAVESVKVTTE